jgi:hypothetical protein
MSAISSGSKGEVRALNRQVGFTLNSGQGLTPRQLTLCANSDLDRAFVRVSLFCDDVHALKVLRVDGFLQYAGLFCFVDECRE